MFTTTPYGDLLVDIQGKKPGRHFALSMDIKKGRMKELDQRLWVEGNLSVDYGGELEDEYSRNFSLIFDPVLMKEALEIPLDQVTVLKNTYFQSLMDGEAPPSAALFPYGQHFIIKQNQPENELTGEDLKKPLFRGILISSLVTYGLIGFLLLRLFF